MGSGGEDGIVVVRQCLVVLKSALLVVKGGWWCEGNVGQNSRAFESNPVSIRTGKSKQQEYLHKTGIGVTGRPIGWVGE